MHLQVREQESVKQKNRIRSIKIEWKVITYSI